MSRENDKKSIWANYLYNVLYDIFVLIVPLITTPYIVRVLSVELIGINSYSYSIIQYFTAFVALGTKSYAIKKISRAETKAQVSVTFWSVFLLRAFCGLFALIFYFTIVVTTLEYRLVSAIQSIYILSVIFDISWFFQGMENFKIIVWRNVVIKILSMVVIFAFVKSDNSFILYISSLAVLTLLGNISLFTHLKKFLVLIPLKEIKPLGGLKEILVLFIPTLALQIYSAVDKTMIGTITHNMSENGYYDQASKITHICLTLVSALSIVVLPRIAQLYEKRETIKIQYYMEKSYNFILMIAIPMIVGMNLISDILVQWFLGEAYMACVPMLNLFSLIFLISGASNITGFQYLVATDRQSYYSITIAAGTAVNLVLNYFLIRRYSSFGAVIASVISESFILLMQLVFVFFIKKELSMKKNLAYVWQYIFGAVIMAVVLFYLKKLPLHGFVHIFVCIAVATAVYFVILLLIKNPLVDSLIHDKFKGKNV